MPQSKITTITKSDYQEKKCDDSSFSPKMSLLQHPPPKSQKCKPQTVWETPLYSTLVKTQVHCLPSIPFSLTPHSNSSSLPYKHTYVNYWEHDATTAIEVLGMRFLWENISNSLVGHQCACEKKAKRMVYFVLSSFIFFLTSVQVNIKVISQIISKLWKPTQLATVHVNLCLKF